MKKLAFVTGGSRGIGRSICIELARNKFDVIIGYNSNKKEALLTKHECDSHGVFTKIQKINILDLNSVKKAFQNATNNEVFIDVLVNNAGINKPTDFDQITESDWNEILNVNLRGPFFCSQVSLKYFNNGGSIINIGSVSGQYGGPRTAHYAASKAGLISLGQVIARFVANRNIRCNTIAAGLIDSTMANSGLQSPSVNQASQNILLKRLGTFDEVAKAVIFLATDNSSYITGQTINVNGGLYF
jgi:3-oxoacyl-[acyl-carrier protein] reductase